jgi:hypothetical protein
MMTKEMNKYLQNTDKSQKKSTEKKKDHTQRCHASSLAQNAQRCPTET